MKKITYTVENIYGPIDQPMTETTYRTPEAALKDCAKREGCGWIVLDSTRTQWQMDGDTARCC